MSMSAVNHPLPQVVLTRILERAVRFELTYTGFAIRRLAAWRRAQIGAEGEIRTLEASLEDSHVSSYITSAKIWNSWQDLNPQPRRSKRRALPVELQERRDFGLRIADFRIAKHSARQVRRPRSPNYWNKSAIRNPKSEIFYWSGRTELNCHHECPKLGC